MTNTNVNTLSMLVDYDGKKKGVSEEMMLFLSDKANEVGKMVTDALCRDWHGQYCFKEKENEPEFYRYSQLDLAGKDHDWLFVKDSSGRKYLEEMRDALAAHLNDGKRIFNGKVLQMIVDNEGGKDGEYHEIGIALHSGVPGDETGTGDTIVDTLNRDWHGQHPEVSDDNKPDHYRFAYEDLYGSHDSYAQEVFDKLNAFLNKQDRLVFRFKLLSIHRGGCSGVCA